MSKSSDLIHTWEKKKYPYGFKSRVRQMLGPKGLTEETVCWISKKKKEPQWLLDWRLKAYNYWKTLSEPTWGKLRYVPIDYQNIHYYAAPQKPTPKKLSDVDPAILETFNRLGIPLQEQKRLTGVAVDVVLDSVSVGTTFQEALAEKGILFCSFSEAVQRYPELVRSYLGRVVSYKDNFFAALNAAVFSDGSFAYIPKGVRCDMELSTYFRINEARTGQFERTLIVAEPGSYVSYLEGCSAPMQPNHQLHAAVVEILVKEEAEVKYATIQNWFPGDEKGQGGVYNFVTKRGLCAGKRAKLSWTQLEVGAAITWKYPSCILKGEESVGAFYSVSMTKHKQQADTGTKMIHLGPGTKSKIVAKGIAAGQSQNSYRGLVKIMPTAKDAHNFSQCDSLLLQAGCGAHTYPYIEETNGSATVAHEATTTTIDENMTAYLYARGLSEEEAVALLVGGTCDEVLRHLPMEFAVEGRKLLSLSLEGAVG